ncbi:hypothetical protein DYB37_011207 [Aphanomyces astaci]|uniref:Uncharacterized protein n=1 Tax=Aphanomyces astaci TaxID=112090 RepID=A0A3R6XTT3_APHAT|nr:hypothetical protein DYB37_011207 [Aphanomyces astaci]
MNGTDERTRVLGESGYVRWMLEDAPLFEIPSVTLTKPPQAGPGKPRNPIKLPIEEPLYIIFNIAVARAWGATPPNADIGPCRGNASKPVPGTYEFNKTQNICDSFPMYMEIEYIRVYQDKSSMFVGCPRCTKFLGGKSLDMSDGTYFGPTILYPAIVASATAALIVLTCVWRMRQRGSAAAIASSMRKSRVEGEMETVAEIADGTATGQSRRYYAPANTAE